MIQGIMKIDFKTNADFAAYAKEKKQDKYGNPRRLPLSLKQELEEALEVSADQLVVLLHRLFCWQMTFIINYLGLPWRRRVQEVEEEVDADQHWPWGRWRKSCFCVAESVSSLLDMSYIVV